MITSFTIKKFRLFEHFYIEGLKTVNLLVGKNNAGKSAFLEAMELFASDASIDVLFNLVTSRQETWSGSSVTTKRTMPDIPLRHLFYGHILPDINQEGIKLQSSAQTALHIHTTAYESQTTDEGFIRRIPLQQLILPLDLTDLDIALVAEEGDRVRRLLWIDRNFEREYSRLRRSPDLASSLPKYVTQTVPTSNMTGEKIAALWDQTSLTDLETEVINGLKLIDPMITGIGFVEGVNGRSRESRIPLIRRENISEPLPLRSMGDGMTRLFHIIVALVNAKDGILLVDEFENGLHWSVQPLIWKTVFRLAERLNVQVFASTHSRDCVFGFQEAWKENEDRGSFCRMDVDASGKVKATLYNREVLSDALETEVEVR
jgi:predicted ATP-dependent endonuclease of OLD family